MRAKLAVSSLTRAREGARAFLLVVLRRRLGTWGAGGGSVLLHVQWRSRLAWSDGVSVWNGMVPYRYGRLLAWSRTSGVSLRFLALAQKSQPQVLFIGSSYHPSETVSTPYFICISLYFSLYFSKCNTRHNTRVFHRNTCDHAIHEIRSQYTSNTPKYTVRSPGARGAWVMNKRDGRVE